MMPFHWQPLWDHACLRCHGRVLDGVLVHYCPDWDCLPIDETCEEIVDCLCKVGVDEEYHRAAAEAWRWWDQEMAVMREAAR